MPAGRETIRRVQVGLVGLSAIVIVLSIGSAIIARLRSDPAKTAANVAAKPIDKSPDTEAKLGIAPANQPDSTPTATNSATVARPVIGPAIGPAIGNVAATPLQPPTQPNAPSTQPHP